MVGGADLVEDQGAALLPRQQVLPKQIAYAAQQQQGDQQPQRQAQVRPPMATAELLPQVRDIHFLLRGVSGKRIFRGVFLFGQDGLTRPGGVLLHQRLRLLRKKGDGLE